HLYPAVASARNNTFSRRHPPLHFSLTLHVPLHPPSQPIESSLLTSSDTDALAMSGFEIAGLVLGAFPIFCDAAKNAEGILQKAKSWWHFEATFPNFIANLETQEIAYSQVLRRLLGSLKISRFDYDTLRRDPASDLWHRPDIQNELRSYLLDEESQWFTRKLWEMNQALVDLHGLLPTQNKHPISISQSLDLSEIYSVDAKDIESELLRLRASFSGNKDRLLTLITTTNNELHQFLDRVPVSREWAKHKAEKQESKHLISPLRGLHDEAIRLHAGLAHQWQCRCSTAHTIGISPAKCSGQGSRAKGCFNMMFEYGIGRKQLNMEVEASTTANADARRVYIPPLGLDIETAGKIQGDWRLKQQLKSANASSKGKGIATLAFASLSMANPQHSEPNLKAMLERPSKKLKKSFVLPSQRSGQASSCLTSASIQTGSTQAAAMSASYNSGLNSVVMTMNEPRLDPGMDGTSTSSQSSAGTQSNTASSISSTDTCSQMMKSDIENMCHFATSEPSLPERGHTFKGRKDDRITFSLDPADQKALKASETQSIDQFLSTSTTRYSRIAVGLRFAITLLSLATSAWMPLKLAKDDIFLVRRMTLEGKYARPYGPYFQHNSHDLSSAASRNGGLWNAKSSLLILGVVLLELFHGEALEQQPSWMESLDDDGCPNEMTAFCAAFLWVVRAQKSMEEYIGEDLGGELYEAIRKCICFDFDREDDFGDSRFAELVYREVVVPLEKCCPQF
ncbi:hypothetical protein CKAH01_00334, partial [Colletotrichum kahawae]